MKKIGFILFFVLFSFSLASAYENQGFTSYQEIHGNISFQCDSQCFVLIGDANIGNYVDIQGTAEGNGIVGYGFLQGQQIIPGATTPVNQLTNINQKFIFSDSPYWNQLPKNTSTQIMLLVQGNIKGQLKANLGEIGPIDTLKKGFVGAMKYIPYNPRTINFLEGPMWNGKYINQSFMKIMLILLILSILGYIFSSRDNDKRKFINIGVGILIFFWIFFDFFSTVNQVKIYNDTMDASNIMENGRLGKESDFYQFLDFIKTQVPSKDRGFFIAPYPFNFEGKYHIYPDIKFGNITGVNYLFFYNPYGVNNGVGFTDPIYSGNILERDNMQFAIEKEIVRKPYAKIYRIIYR